MKRKITNLEQKMFDKGWKLEAKNYAGKYSQWTDFYQYCKEYKLENAKNNVDLFICLDKKREKIVYYWANFNCANILDELVFNDMTTLMNYLRNEVMSLKEEKYEQETTIN